ncbi:hypothetical protein N7452_003952 [Penicillium brevicompactum]|uniref:Uncharacterized protein n=1 Tax=Penicillium brevicompactum TaxID=5074 RepID=A0A9W9QXK2_PENBR|nr:hypothetical protein N7452_003952 [Penicillium brevicompactum]
MGLKVDKGKECVQEKEMPKYRQDVRMGYLEPRGIENGNRASGRLRMHGVRGRDLIDIGKGYSGVKGVEYWEPRVDRGRVIEWWDHGKEMVDGMKEPSRRGRYGCIKELKMRSG